MARIAQAAREQGILAVMTMNTRQLSCLEAGEHYSPGLPLLIQGVAICDSLFPDGHDHRKATTRARNVLMDEHRKHAADNLKRGELLATELRAEPEQPETDPSEQQPKLGTQLDTGRK